MREDELPRLMFRGATVATARYFPDRLPIGCHPDGRAPVLLYLVRTWDSFDFRTFLQRHGPLLRTLADWRIRLLVPPHLRGAEERYQITCWNELATPLTSEAIEELRWYFERRRALYRQWPELGNGLLEF